MNARLIAILSMLGALILGPTAPANADVLSATSTTVSGATLVTAPPAPAAPVGVSPAVTFDGMKYWLWIAGQTFTSPDGTTWTPLAGARLPMGGVDWSLVVEGPNSYRMYYADITGARPCSPGAKRLRMATSTDLITWTPRPEVLIADIGCGVPHVLKTSSGAYLAYYNLLEPERGVHVATSPDGLAWTQLPGVIANDPDVVDPAAIQMPDGTFLMLGAKHGSPNGYKGLRILTSPDGRRWSERPQWLATPSGGDALDPALAIVNGSIRVWFPFAADGKIDAARLATGVLSLAPASSTKTVKLGAACAKRGAVSGTFVCQKRQGKLVWVRR